MLLLTYDSEFNQLSKVLEIGDAINLAGDAISQSPVHLAACGKEAFCLLQFLQSGGNADQQDSSGEAPLHKAARSGSLECISLLVASGASIDLYNTDGQTAEDIAWSCGFSECATYLAVTRSSQCLKSYGCPGSTRKFFCSAPLEDRLLGKKRSHTGAEDVTGKRARPNELIS
ncbi:ankyrin repeat domain-containing protein 37 [Protopterus annectens]|uniref:ankyrin repeat domain-containing protein 37 n=1 Tax=Protopterus annectens TaxID=7888 RepID=UPI001CFC0A37|nr:ankyrin repeat domain-containing protein 37 [Protopterus annectens]